MVKRKIIPAVILVIAAAVFIYSGIQLFGRRAGLNKGRNEYERIAEAAVSVRSDFVSRDPEDGISEEIVPEAPVSVDFKEAENIISAEPAAWIFSENTPINYPVMQADDNDYYLRRLPDGTSNICGSIFMDHRCPSDLSAFNTIIYGHSFYRNDEYFGTLSNYKNRSYYEDHKVFYLITPERNCLCRVFAGFVTDGVSSVFNIPSGSEEINAYLEYVFEHSDFDSGVSVTSEDRIVVLSTCSYDRKDARYVVFAKLY